MSSSDSEDDCYGNVAQKLQSIKNKYQTENLKTDDTVDLRDLDENKVKITIEEDENVQKKNSEDVNLSIISTDNDECLLDDIIANNALKKCRGTGRGKGRGRKRKSNEEIDNEPSSTRVTRSSRGKTGNTSHDTTPPVVLDNNEGSRRGRGRNSQVRSSGTQVRGRGRGRGRGRRTTNHETSSIPTYSVGNTDEYPDMCDNQELFSSKSDDLVEINEVDPLEDNEELSVKVYWQNLEVFRFKIRKYQKLTQIFNYFAKTENVGHDKLLFTYNDRILKFDDTPDTINYNIAKFIDGGIVNQNVTTFVKNDNRTEVVDGIKIKFQCQDMKKPYEMTVRPEDKLAFAMMKYSEHIEKPLERLKFYFDGDLFTGNSTAKDLDLEGGECIDVKLSS